jgi:serine protease AprX
MPQVLRIALARQAVLAALLLAFAVLVPAQAPAQQVEEDDSAEVQHEAPEAEDADPDSDHEVDEPDQAEPETLSPDDTVVGYEHRSPDSAWQESIRLTAVPAAHDGAGVTVAVLDTGVTRHPDLGGRVIARADLTPDGNGFDRYGHGTHMAGVIAGDGSASGGRWSGAAPGASVLSVKVAGFNGATDVSAVLAGLEWIAAHHERYGIRVLNLSYGTDSSQTYLEDPLNHAVERLWEAGVLVVVGAGNRGDGGSKIEKPGDDPYVLTVGAADTHNTAALGDDEVAPFSSVGPTSDGVAKPDLVAPGVCIVSHRAPASAVDVLRPVARLEDHYFKGSGTSQAAAVVSGVAARLFDADPSLTPDEAKAALVGTASPALAGRPGAGAGLVNAAAAVAAVEAGVGAAPANHPRSSGLGSLDSSRGAAKPYTDWKEPGKPEQLSGEVGALGTPWDRAASAARPWTPATWASSPWAPYTTVASGWGEAPAARPWSGLGWDESSWIARSWGDLGLPDPDWTARSWGDVWMRLLDWAARSWGGRDWIARSWGGSTWNGFE